MFRVLYCNIGAEGQPDRTSTVSTDVNAVKLLELLEKHSEHRICMMSVPQPSRCAESYYEPEI